jgi:hypothetical protein
LNGKDIKIQTVNGMNYYEKLTKDRPPRIGNMFGSSHDGHAERLAGASRLAGMMQMQRPFCFTKSKFTNDLYFRHLRRA